MRASFRLALALAAAVAGGVGCGGRHAYRSLAVDVEGVSRLAESLVLAVFPKSTGQMCAAISLSNVASLSAPISARWTRGAERSLSVPEVDEDDVVVVVYTEDAAGKAIQLACVDVRWADIQDGLLSLRLSEVAMMRPWQRRSVPSSSSTCSVEGGWRRSSSRIDEDKRSASSSSGSGRISRRARAKST